VPEFTFTKEQFKELNDAKNSQRGLVLYLSDDIMKEFYSNQSLDEPGFQLQTIDGYCYLKYKTIDDIHSFTYESDGFGVELLKCDILFTSEVMSNSEWHPRLITYNVRGVSQMMFGIIAFAINDCEFIQPVYDILFFIDITEVTLEFEKRLLNHERQIRVIKVDFSYVAPNHFMQRKMFTRFIYLAECKKPISASDVKFRSLPVSVRNCFTRFEDAFFRVTKIRSQAYVEALNLVGTNMRQLTTMTRK
jgi:hypothetical protein